ncbi:MAG: cob(I)yrinic acid a,c-diamide adenosyltransferase [bacterium]|nr:cob(I)yrinic acid a,c-diamide adenosyltransferase [bacterium]
MIRDVSFHTDEVGDENSISNAILAKRWLMSEGLTQVFCGEGKGKTTAAIGQAIRVASQGRSVFVIQFLKGKSGTELEYIKRLEPEIKLFSFEKSEEFFSDLTEDEQKEEIRNIRNGLCFAKKVLVTGECDHLILDEILGLIDTGIMSIEDLKGIIDAKPEDATLVLTGIHLTPEIAEMVDEVSQVMTVKSMAAVS